MSSGQTSLEQMLGVYKWVVDDVMKNVREDFLNEGADTQVLEDLKQLWENKLVQSGALSRPMKPAETAHPIKETISQDKQKSNQQPVTTPLSSAITRSSPVSVSNTTASVIQQAPPRSSPSLGMTTPTTSSAVSFTPPSLSAHNSSPNSRPSGGSGGVSQATPSQTPPQITGVGAANTPPFLNMALAQQALYSAITGGGANPVGGAGTTLPVVLPSSGLSLVQHGGIPYAAVPTPAGLQYVPIALNLPGTIPPNTSSETSSSNNITQSDGPHPLTPPHKRSSKVIEGLDSIGEPSGASPDESSLPVISFELPAGITPSHFFSSSKRKSRSLSHRAGAIETIPQLDGPPPPPDASSSEDSDESSESDPDDIEGEQDDDEDPLNSNDDAESDEEDDVWETDNTIVCQFEKVYRVRAKWKFALKDGIMHLNGHDYIFTKTAGEAEW